MLKSGLVISCFLSSNLSEAWQHISIPHHSTGKKNDNQDPSHKRQIVNRIGAYCETAWKSKTGSEVSMNLHYSDLEAAPLRGIDWNVDGQNKSQ